MLFWMLLTYQVFPALRPLDYEGGRLYWQVLQLRALFALQTFLQMEKAFQAQRNQKQD